MQKADATLTSQFDVHRAGRGPDWAPGSAVYRPTAFANPQLCFDASARLPFSASYLAAFVHIQMFLVKSVYALAFPQKALSPAGYKTFTALSLAIKVWEGVGGGAGDCGLPFLQSERDLKRATRLLKACHLGLENASTQQKDYSDTRDVMCHLVRMATPRLQGRLPLLWGP